MKLHNKKLSCHNCVVTEEIITFHPKLNFFKTKNIQNVEKHLLPQFVNTIQSNLFIECIQIRFLFLNDCRSKHVGQIVSYKGF